MELRVHRQESAVGSNDVGGEEVIDRHAVLANEISDPAPRSESPDSDRAGIAEAGREAMGGDGGRVFPRGESRFGPSRAVRNVDLDPLHVSEIENDPIVDGTVAGDAVPSASDGQVDTGLPSEGHHARHVPGISDADDDRPSAIDVVVENGARFVVVVVIGADDPSLQLITQARERHIAGV